MKIVKHLLFKQQERKQLIIAMLGTVIGILFMLLSIHYLIKVNSFGKDAAILGPNTLIVQKQVNTSSTLNLVKTDFSEEEIAILKKEPFIDDVQAIISNNFDVLFATDDPMVPKFSSDVFVQTLNPKFIDISTKNWTWKEGDSIVPIYLPRDFLVMLNTFMSANNIPQVSDELAKDIRFKLRLRNEEGKTFYIGAKIIGFTNEVAAILVPQSFMDFGNKNYGNATPLKITQLIISGKEKEFGKLEQLLKTKHLESKNAQVVVGRLKSIVSILILVILSLSIIAVFNSSLVLIQYAQLLITKNMYEVRTLMRIAYHPKQLVRLFSSYFIKIFSIVSILGFALFFIAKIYLDELFNSSGIYLDKELTSISILSLVFAIIMFSLSTFLSARKTIYKEF